MTSAGLHFGMPADDYHADPCPAPSLSSTLARLILDRSPLHAWTASPRLNPDHQPRDSATFDIGRAAHRAVLGAGADYAVIPTDLLALNGAASTKAAKEFTEQARAAGLTPIKEDVAEQVEAMAHAVRRRLAAMGIGPFAPARSEVVALAQIDGVWCRAMVDHAPTDPRRPLYDFKTTTDASPDAVVRAVEAYGYDVQAAFYQDVWRAATGESRKFRFVFVEKEPPYEVSVVELHDDPDAATDWMMTARSKVSEARRIWGECIAADYWPGYPAQVAIIGARAFHLSRWADRAIGQPIAKPGAAALREAYAAQAPKEVA